ncbi:NADAR family protein [Phytohabitans sp. LJ34]|uniref:NADAR family protein n=1 Tax=Phytohabitans sp. LJ34 TaxID=3452217 RepID=UPI003F8A9E6A
MTPKERLTALRDAELDGKPMKIAPFWGHRPTASGMVGPSCLSQWWLAEFTVDGVTYPTAEHWMMAAKARLFGDDEGLAAVLAARSPVAAKAAGRKVRDFHQQKWVDARYDIVVTGNLAKFSQHEGLREFLLATGDRVLVEASPYDPVWGIGMGPNNPDVAHPLKWRGLNLLGFALMDVRERL